MAQLSGALTRPARDLHPAAWWLWALGLAVAATTTTNPFLLTLLIGAAGFTVAARRGEHSWSRAFGLYLGFGAIIVVVRVLFQVLLGGGYGTTVWLWLPEIPLPDWVLGIRLLGPVTREAVLSGLYTGLQLATLVICVGAANSLANPKRLLKMMPPALYEIGTALVVAVSVLPQIAESVQRVRAARLLRGAPSGRFGRLRGLVVPVMEDALERSITLAAGMDARGYGRGAERTRAQRWATGSVLAIGLVGICAGAYAALDQSGTFPARTSALLLGPSVLISFAGAWLAGRGVRRTRYRPDHWHLEEVLVAGTGIVVAILAHLLSRSQVEVFAPRLETAPGTSLAALLVCLAAALPAVLAPRPGSASVRVPPRREVAVHARAA